MRLPVAAKKAFRTAGAATQIVGSPTPPQNPPDGMMIDSTFGICAIRIESYVVEVRLLDAAVLDRALLHEQRGQPVDERPGDLPLDLRRVDGVARDRSRTTMRCTFTLLPPLTEISAHAAT